MATEAQLEAVVRKVIGPTMVRIKGDPTGATFILSKANGTLTWVDDQGTANFWRFIGVQTDPDGTPADLDASLIAGIPIINRADLEKRIGKPYPY